MRRSIVLYEGDKVLSATGKTEGLNGRVEKIPGNSRFSNSAGFRIAWQVGHGIKEEILEMENGEPIYKYPIFILDRDYKIGTKVIENGEEGTIVGVEKVATLSLETSDNRNFGIKLQKIPQKLLKRPLETEIGEFVLWNDWLGKIKDMTVKVVYYFEDADVICSVSGEEKHLTDSQCHKYPFPFVGQQLSRLSLSQLWDADWEDRKWFKNTFKYMRKKAKVISVMVDSITPDWIRKIPYESEFRCTEEERKNLPKYLVDENLQKVSYLYGNEYSKIGERSLCKYNVKEGDEVVYLGENKEREMTTATEYSKLKNKAYNLEISEEGIFTVLHLWNNYLIEWTNGVQESFFVQERGILSTVPDPNSVSFTKSLSRGTIVEMQDYLRSDYNTGYGIVLSENPNRIVNVKWVIPLGAGYLVEETQNSIYDLKLSEKYWYLEDLNNFPIVLDKKSLQVGVVTSVDTDEARVTVKLPNGTEVRPYVHEAEYIPEYSWLPVSAEEEEEEIGDSHANKIDLEQLSFDPFGAKGGFLVSEQVNDEKNFYHLNFAPRKDDFLYLIAVEKELASFEDLPEGMWIQGFADRSDLYTAVLRGKPGTIYQDALLVFDVALPQDFPAVTPEVTFRSFGLDINPKIHSSGEIVLPSYSELISLPNINENPCIILNSLSWIQNEILVNDPYYLICTNGKDSGDTFVEAHSKLYNEYVLLNLLTYQQKIVKNVPENWESFFLKYYCENLPKIIKRFESLLLPDGITEENNVSERGDASMDAQGDGFHISLNTRLEAIRSSSLLLNEDNM